MEIKKRIAQTEENNKQNKKANRRRKAQTEEGNKTKTRWKNK